PSKPYITEVIAGNKRLTVTWTADISAAAYTLHYSGDGESGSINVEPTPISVTGTIPSLTNGKVYTVYVVACNSQGDSDQSNNDYGIPEDISVPIDFNNLKFTLGTADAEYIFVHNLPKSPAFSTGRPGTDRLTRVRETALGNLFTDGAAWYVREKLGEDIDFVFLNGGYIDNALAAGQITTGALAAMVDVDSREYTFTILTLKGSAVKELFDFSANVVHTGRGSSGTGAWGIVSEEVNYTIDYPVFTPAEIASPANPPSRPLEDYRHGEIRNGSLKINGADIVDSNDYRIAVASSLAEGQEGYLVFPINAKNIRETTIPFWHGVAEYIYDQGSITPYLDGRIKIYGGVPLGDLQEPYNDPSYTFVP
ncbi:MAG: 5'-nucleotidase C-terminal domain-containing protein, partial [Deferribacteraceae bacterium]|nr:5'-nucleotidase C-terminal domain-containing protein [Deferribacteraceae bacterium]